MGERGIFVPQPTIAACFLWPLISKWPGLETFAFDQCVCVLVGVGGGCSCVCV